MWPFRDSQTSFCGNVGERLRPNAPVCIDLVLREEDVAADAEHVSKLELDVLQGIVKVLFFIWVNNGISKVDIEFEGLMVVQLRS
jgi:hypothetical protein